MATVKYFYISDDTAILFGANGTALTATLAAVSGMISNVKFPIPTFPMWIYFLGLIFAFLAKAIIGIFNDDVREREKSQSVRDFIMEAMIDPHATDLLREQLSVQWIEMEDRRKILLKIATIDKLNKWRAIFFYISALCFLAGTSTIILFVGSKLPAI
ncbi:hypothetical protein [Rhizobium sp.]|uniref:hypothetical protein n=1 Tax=Rhizobium sp. TaxID=391 RepID=UPI002F245D61